MVLDKDGVLLDFSRLWGQMTRLRMEFLAEALGGWCPPELELASFLGLDEAGRPHPAGRVVRLPGTETLKEMESWLSARGVPSAFRARIPWAFAAAASRLPPEAYRSLPGVRQALVTLKEDGWSLAVATSDTAAHTRNSLEKADLLDLLPCRVGGDEVSSAKPAPDLFLAACARAGFPTGLAAAIGDGPADMRMARSGAAAKVIGLRSGVGRDEELRPLADLVFDDLHAAAGHLVSHGLS